MIETIELFFKRTWISIVPTLIVCLIILIGNTQSVHAKDYPIDINTFQSSAFADFVKDKFDPNGDGVLSQEEADSVTQISFNEWWSDDYEISTLNGIEVFRNLKVLQANEISLEYLDVSKNTALETLRVNYNRLTSLDLSKNTALKCLECEGNDIPNLILPQNAPIYDLNCFGIGLTSLDLTGYSELKRLNCGGNGLTSLDLSGNPKLTELQCIATDLTSLDLSKNPLLMVLVCSSNNFAELNLSKNLDLLYAYQNGWTNSVDYEGVEATEYGCMYGSDEYYMAVPPTTKIITGGVYAGKDGTLIKTPNGQYKVLSTKAKTVAFASAPNTKSVNIPNTFKVNNKAFKVTEVWYVRGDKVRTVTIGKNVKYIKDNAFNGSKATKVILKTKLLTKAKIKGCFKQSKIKTIQVKVGTKKQNKTYVKKYKKIFTKKTVGVKATVR